MHKPAATDRTDDECTVGIFTVICALSLLQFSPHNNFQGILIGFQLMVMEWIMGYLKDQQMNLMIYRQKGNFLGIVLSGNLVQEYS